MNLNIHDVIKITQIKDEGKIESMGRVYYTNKINIQTKEGNFEICLFSDVEDNLKVIE